MKTKLEAMKDLSGVKNKKLVLMRPEEIPDDAGGHETEYVPVATVWGELRSPRPSVIAEAGAVAGEFIHEFKIWNRSDVERDWHVMYKEKELPIINTYSFDAENIILVCREVIR